MNRILLIMFSLILIYFSCKTKNEGVWELVWSDEFNYTGLPDDSKWNYDTCRGCGNNELQYYTEEDLENARVEGGFLIIEARKQDTLKYNYTSARIKTKNKGYWKYGRFEIKADIPEGRGIWAAIWMLPKNWEYGNWPESGEIDIMEYVGYNPGTIYGTVHTGAFNHLKNTHIGDSVKVNNVEKEFHVYALEWDKEKIKVFVDDNHYFTFENKHKTHKEWPFDNKFHLILNIAVGGNWGGKYGVDDIIFPQQMKVDYVRVYQKKVNRNIHDEAGERF